MGQKVNPIAFRVGVMEGWKSRWYAAKIRRLVRDAFGRRQKDS